MKASLSVFSFVTMTSYPRWHVPISITSAASPSSPVKVMMDREAEVTTVRLPGVSISTVLYVLC